MVQISDSVVKYAENHHLKCEVKVLCMLACNLEYDRI
jgi:hypothetical protein